MNDFKNSVKKAIKYWAKQRIQLGLKVKYLVSDRAKAIVKLALKDLGTHSIADLFQMVLLLRRDYLATNFPTCLSILLNISVNYLNRGSPENHPSPKLLPCLLSRLKLVVDYLWEK